MTRMIPILIGCLLVIPQPAVAARRGGPWSPDGSAEAATLRADARSQAQRGATQTEGARGVAYVKQDAGDAAFSAIAGTETVAPVDVGPAPATAGTVPAEVGPPAPAIDPALTPSVDPEMLQRRYELERIAKRGRSFFIPGIVLTTLGTIVLIGGIAGLAKEANAVTGTLTGVSAAIAATGWPLLIVGVRMRKHPERYLGRSRAQAKLAPTGLVVRF
jgi:hypothetical protein